MANRHKLQALAVMLLVGLGLGCNMPLPGRATPREPLDTLWEERMLEGRGVRMWLDERCEPATVEEGKSLAHLRTDFEGRKDPTSYLVAFSDPYGITVLRHGEGYWRNGGWTLTGGPLGIARDEDSTVELFGKAIIRTPVHIPAGMLHRDPPTNTAYEFFLLQRSQTSGMGAIIRRWVVQPRDVVLDRHGYPRVEAVLSYEATTQVASVSIGGVTQPINDRVDFSASPASR